MLLKLKKIRSVITAISTIEDQRFQLLRNSLCSINNFAQIILQLHPQVLEKAQFSMEFLTPTSLQRTRTLKNIDFVI